MQQLSSAQTSPEAPINENFDTLAAASVFGRRHAATTGTTWAFYGGVWGGVAVADGTLALSNGNTNYVTVHRATGAVSVATNTTAWADTATNARAHLLIVSGGAVTSVEDHRYGLGGTHGPASRPEGVSADRGDAGVTLAVGADATVQRFATSLSTARTITLSTTGARNGDRFRVVRSGLGAGTLAVGSLKTMPAATAAWADVHFDGTAWVLTGYGTL